MGLGSLLKFSTFRKWPAEVILPYGFWVAQALPTRSWLVDDAGISFVYARNLMQGYGLVSQPSLSPVEGYSNPLWTFLLAPFFIDDPVDPTLRIKLLSAALVLITFFVLRSCVSTLVESAAARLATAGLLTLLSLNTSFIVWSSSGLENPLSALLVVVFLKLTLPFDDDGPSRPWLAGAALAGLALTRPDAIVFLAVLPLWAVLQLLRPIDQRVPGFKRMSLVATATALAILALTSGARWLYFESLLPNTYHAKGGPGLAQILELLTLAPQALYKSLDIPFSVLGLAAGLVIVAGTLLMPKWLRSGPYRQARLLTLLTLLAAWAAYVLLPPDWMGEFRFGTSAIVLLCLVIASLIGDLSTSAGRSHRRLISLAAGVVLISAAAANGPRLGRFASEPTVPFRGVAVRFGLAFNLYAERLSIRDASLACPDVGGTLYFSEHLVFDLGGLCNRDVARAMHQGPKALQEIVLGDLRPTFIHLHGVWSARYRLDLDPRFERDYLLIIPVPSANPTVHRAQPSIEGDWVRRDALEDPKRLLALRLELRSSQSDFFQEAQRQTIPFPRNRTRERNE